MKNMTVFKGTLVSCSIIATAFSLLVFFTVGSYTEQMISDTSKLFFVMEGGAILASLMMPLLFKKKWCWHWPMLIIAVPVHVVFAILIIVVIF